MSITVMAELNDLDPKLIQQAHKEPGIRITVVKNGITGLIAMLTSGDAPDPVDEIQWYYNEHVTNLRFLMTAEAEAVAAS
ncbi:hypothetical protein AB0N07_42990 [Streptomyces sp. NPDC051172]|uniref:hypothetical protein n=1 Tax=Streptomyces sp. NPDC051172 TaxID=3155796 RepID=UPI0034304E2D